MTTPQSAYSADSFPQMGALGCAVNQLLHKLGLYEIGLVKKVRRGGHDAPYIFICL